MKLNLYSARAIEQYSPAKLLIKHKRDLKAELNELELIERESAFEFEKVVFLRKVTKVVKGGRKHRYCALVVVGDTVGCVGAAMAKAVDAQDAAIKASQRAHRLTVDVPLTSKGALPFSIEGKHNNTKIIINNSREGKGSKASNITRAVLDAMGAKDISIKLIGSRNPHNVIKAMFNALNTLIDYCQLWR